MKFIVCFADDGVRGAHSGHIGEGLVAAQIDQFATLPENLVGDVVDHCLKNIISVL